MAKKVLKTVVGIGAAVAAGKIAYDKAKFVKESYSKEEEESIDSEVRKYNAAFDKKIVEVDDEEFKGCEIKAVCATMVLDLGTAKFTKDEYINFSAKFSNLTIVVPEGINVSVDDEVKCANVKNLVDEIEGEDVTTLFVIGNATVSNIEIIPVNFYVDDDDDFDEDDFEEDEPETETEETFKVVEDVEEAEKAADTEIKIEVVEEEKADKEDAKQE